MKKRLKRLVRSTLQRLQPRRPSFRRLGDDRRAVGDWAMAARHYRTHVETNADDFDIWVQLGHALKESGRFADADDAYATAARLRSDDSDVALSRGHLAKLRGDQTEATKFYRESLAIDGNAAAANELGVLGHEYTSSMATSQSPGGAIESVTGGLIRGWAVNPHDPNRAIAVEALVDEQVILTVEADVYRADLPSRGDDSRLQGFVIDLSSSLDLSAPTELHLRTKNGKVPLHGSPILIGGTETYARWTARWANNEVLRRHITQSIGEDCERQAISIIFAPRKSALPEHLSIKQSLQDQIDANYEPIDLSAGASDTTAQPAHNVDRATLENALKKARGHHVILVDNDSTFEPEWIWRVRDAAGNGADLIFWDDAEISEKTGNIRSFRRRPATPVDVHSIGTFAITKSAALAALKSLPSVDAVDRVDFLRACLGQAKTIAHIPCTLERRHRERHAEATQGMGSKAEQVSDATPPDTTFVIVVARGDLNALQSTVHALTDQGLHKRHGLGVLTHEAEAGPLSRFSQSLEAVAKVANQTGSGSLALALNTAVSAWSGSFTNVAFIESGLRPSGQWLDPLVRLLNNPDTGVASPLIVDSAGTILSAGLYASSDRLVHSHQGARDGLPATTAPEWALPRTGTRPQSAAYGCLVIRRDIFLDAGGLDPSVAPETVFADFCLRLGATGRRTLVHADAAVTSSILDRSIKMDPVFKARWSELVGGGDPHHHPALDENYRLERPNTMFCAVRIISTGQPQPASHARAPLLKPPAPGRPH